MDQSDTLDLIHKKNSGLENFTVLNQSQIKAIWDIIRALDSSKSPMQVLHAFELVILNVNQDTGEIMLTRNQFAQKIGCSPDKITHIMNVLVELCVVTREKKVIKGVQGPGKIVYFINKL